GGNAQTKAMKKVAGSLRLDLAAFRELEAFAQLGTELDKATQQQLDRGYRMVELLKQPQFQPLDTVDQVISIYSGSKGYFDKVPVPRVQEAENHLIAFMRDEKSEVRNAIKNTGTLDDATESSLKKALEDWRTRWESTVMNKA
ncbi:MAG: F0F1 ATP synthase subunit alpha, partial [Planctomycetes bacterium]|nr:F0F1 ATP synthase subunit alpha [Planctomycetota bacterium]